MPKLPTIQKNLRKGKVDIQSCPLQNQNLQSGWILKVRMCWLAIYKKKQCKQTHTRDY